MKKLITVFSILFSFIIMVSCEVSETIPEQQANIEIADSNEVIFDELFQIENGVLAFKDKESFDKLNTYIFSTGENLTNLVVYLKGKPFDNLYTFYKNIDEDDLSEVFKTHQVNDELSKYFVLIPDEEGDLDLEETVKEVFLQLYFNKNLSFKVGEDHIEIKNNRLILRKPNGQESQLKGESKNKNSRVKGTLASSNSVTYRYNGRKYKLKIDTDTRWNSVREAFNDGGYKLLWNRIEYQAIHRRRWAGVYYNTNTSKLRVYGNHQFGTPGIPSNFWNLISQPFDTGEISNSSKVFWPAFAIHSYNATAWCRGHDNQIHSVSTSETNY